MNDDEARESARGLFQRLGQARANNGDKLGAEEWLLIAGGHIKAEVNAGIDGVKTLPKAKRPKGTRNELFDALASACGMNLMEITKAAARSVGVALADIRNVTPELTVAEIKARIAKYQRLHPTWALTAPAIAKNWAGLGDRGEDLTRTAKFDVYQEPPDWKADAVAIHGADIGAQIFDKGWLNISTVYRAEILRRRASLAP